MRRLLLVPLLMAACSGDTVDADFVAVDLYVEFETKLGIETLEVRGARTDDDEPVFARDFEITDPTVVTSTRTARIFLSGASRHAGAEVRIAVTGRDDDGVDVGQSSTKLSLRLGVIETATISIGAPARCGNLALDPGEDCDGGAGCTASCRAEDGFVCVGAPRRCLPIGRTAIVDASALACPGDGSPTEPFCTVARGVMAPWADTIGIRGGVYRGAIRIERTVTVLADAGAIVESSDQPTVDVADGDVIVDGLTVRGLSGVGGGISVHGDQTALELRAGVVGPSSTVGISLRDGALLRSFRSRVEGNAGTGVELASARGFIIENMVVANNDRGVHVIRSSDTSRLSNVTIADNDNESLVCESSARAINTIAWGGVVTSTTVRWCEPHFSDFGPLEAGVLLPTGSFSITPGLTEDQHLTAASPCRDTGDPDSIARGVAPIVDIDGDERPRGPNIDIGADEL